MRATVNSSQSDTVAALNSAILAHINSDNPDVDSMARFTSAQQHLQQTILKSARLVSEGIADQGEQAIRELSEAELLMGFEHDRADVQTRQVLKSVLEKAQISKTALVEYIASLEPIHQQRNTLVNEQGGQLQSQADLIVSAALDQLTRSRPRSRISEPADSAADGGGAAADADRGGWLRLAAPAHDDKAADGAGVGHQAARPRAIMASSSRYRMAARSASWRWRSTRPAQRCISNVKKSRASRPSCPSKTASWSRRWPSCTPPQRCENSWR